MTDKLGFRVSAWYRRDGGYVDRMNYENGAVYPNSNWQNSYVVHAALAWRPSEAIKMTPSLFNQDVHQTDTGGIWESLSDPARGVFENGRVLREPTTDKFTCRA